MNEKVLVLIASFALLGVSLLIGFWSNRSKQSAQKFLGSTKAFGPVVTGLSSMAAMVSGMMLVGGPGYVYTTGNYSMMTALIGCCFTLGYVFIGKKMRGIAELGELSSLGDVLDIRYKASKGIKFCTCAVLFLGSFAYLVTQVSAGGVLFQYLFGWNPYVATFAMFGIVILYMVIGGESAGILSQAFQGLIVVIAGIIVFGLYIFNFGGVQGTMEAIAANPTVTVDGVTANFTPRMMSAFGIDKNGSASNTWVLFAFLGSCCQPAILTRMYVLKDPRDIPKAGLVSGTAQSVACWFSTAIGYSVIYLVASGKVAPFAVTDEAVWHLGEYLGLGIQILLSTAVVAAIISSASMYLSISANMLCRDLAGCVNIKMEGKKQVTAMRISMAVIGVVSIIMAAGSTGAVLMLGFLGWGTLMSISLPVFIVGMIWKKANRKGVFAAAAASLIMNIVALILNQTGFKWPGGVPYYMYTTCVSTVLAIVISLLTYNEQEDGLGKRLNATLDL